MRRVFFILLVFFSLGVKAQSAGRLIVKLKNIQGDSLRYTTIKKYVFDTRRNKIEDRIKDLDRVSRFAEQTNDSLTIAQAQIEKSYIFINNNQYHKAEKILNKVKIPNRHTYVSEILKTKRYFQLGNIQYYSYKYKKALEFYFRAYDIAKAHNFSLQLIKINNNISIILKKQDQQEKALRHFKHNLSLGKLLNSKKIINKSRLNLSLTYYKIHKLDSARYFSKQLIDALNDVSNLRSSAYYIYAKASIDVKPTDSIIALLNKAIYNNDGNYYAYDLLSNIYKKNNQTDKAIAYSLLSLKYAKEYSDIKLIQKELLEIGLLYQQKEAYEKAYKYLRKSKNINDSIRSVKGFNEITKAITKFDSQKKDITIKQQKSVLNTTEKKVKKQKNILLGILVFTLIVAITFVIKFKKQQLAHQITLTNKTNAERNTISKELHETVGEQLTYIISSIDNLLFTKDLTNEHITSEMQRIKEFATKSIMLFRDTLWVLSKSKITSDELFARSEMFFERINSNYKDIKFKKYINFDYKGNINTRTVLVVFRMMQEIIMNAVIHSNTKTIDIYFIRNEKFSIIKIKDYGKGFTPRFETTNYGLKGVRRQIEILGGSMEIIISNGTEIILKIPVHAQS